MPKISAALPRDRRCARSILGSDLGSGLGSVLGSVLASSSSPFGRSRRDDARRLPDVTPGAEIFQRGHGPTFNARTIPAVAGVPGSSRRGEEEVLAAGHRAIAERLLAPFGRR